MNDHLQLSTEISPPQPGHTTSMRDVLLLLYRRKLLVVTLFLAIFLTTAVVTMLIPATYVAQAKILLKQERANSVVSPNPSAATVARPQVSLETINSEIEILKSLSLLKQVVSSTGRARRMLGEDNLENIADEDLIEVAVAHLNRDLEVESVPKSNVIQVSYESHDPRLAAEIVNDLCDQYVERHLEVHETRGIQKFFRNQANTLQDTLQVTAEELRRYEDEHGLVDPAEQRNLLLGQLADYERKLNDTRANQRAAARQVEFLEAQVAAEPERIRTQARKVQNAVLAGLRRELDSLKVRHSELMRVKQNETVQEYERKTAQVRSIKKQIAQLEETILREENVQQQEITTEVTRSLTDLTAELTRARFKAIGYRAQEKELSAAIAKLKKRIQKLEQAAVAHEALKRQWRLNQENYLLYAKKQEEARISEALDREKVANVSIIDPATVPLEPARPNRKLNLAIGFMLAVIVSLVTVLMLSHFDRIIRTSADIERHLHIPVIVAIPEGQTLSRLLQEGTIE